MADERGCRSVRVVFRTDASVQIGTGHVMRCLTLADELRGHGADVSFVCRDLPGNLFALIRSQGFGLEILPAPDAAESWGEDAVEHARWLGVPWQRDATETRTLLAHTDWLVVDHYALDARWEQSLRPYVQRIMVIDDLADRRHDCDLLLDQNLHADPERRYDQLVPEHCCKLLGPHYALLRPEFAEARRHLRSRDGTVRRILVSFGGTDPTNETMKALDAIAMLQRPDLTVDVVVGASNPKQASIRARCEAMSGVAFHRQVDTMAALMAKADLAIGAGGGTSWERCALGLPTLAYPVAHNQSPVLEALAAEGACYLPERASLATPQGLAQHLFALLGNSALCRVLSRNAAHLVDGSGVNRVAMALCPPRLFMRRAMAQDCARLLAWRNHPDTRRHALDPEPIAVDTHQRWCERVLVAPNSILLIAETSAGEPAGVLRFDLQHKQAELSIYLVPGLAGRGLGTAVLSQGEAWLRLWHPEVKVLSAAIMPDNHASTRLFTRAGYYPVQTVYRKRLDK